MTDPLKTLKREIEDAGRSAFIRPMAVTDARHIVALVESLQEDKRRLAAICDDLSAQNAALNQMLRGEIEAQEWDEAMSQTLSPDEMREVKRKLASWGTGEWRGGAR